MNRVLTLALALLALAACDQQRGPDPRQSSNPERYARDRDACRVQVDEYMRNRRNVDDSQRDVFASDSDRMGRGKLGDQMAAYSDTRSYDKLMGSCMEQRGYSQPKTEWWQRLGAPHSI
ncbi:MAG TPA: hypothetical protein VFB13_12210 [Reyranella sp.]|nr:hypothetical protein [Reyranella sp.]